MSHVKNSSHLRGGELAKTLLTFFVLALLYGTFAVASVQQTGDWIGFLASVPFVIATAGIVCAWMTLIRRDSGDEDLRGPAPTMPAAPTVRARVGAPLSAA